MVLNFISNYCCRSRSRPDTSDSRSNAGKRGGRR